MYSNPSNLYWGIDVHYLYDENTRLNMSSVINETNRLTGDAIGNTVSKLNGYGIKLSLEQYESLNIIAELLHSGLNGDLKPSYYLSSLPPGSGKTESISGFIKAWKSNGFKPEGGILICLQSKDQIASLVKRLELDESDFSVLTKDDILNDLGSGSNKIDIVPVLITTQQMIGSRLKDRTFTAASDFYYLGKPRSLRLWDETFALAQPVRLEITSLYSLADKVVLLDRSFSEALTAFSSGLMNDMVGKFVTLPLDLGRYAKHMLAINQANQSRGQPGLAMRYVRTLEALATGGGRSLLLGSYGGLGGGLTLVGASRPLPDDFAPAIIFDASGSVRGTYELMEKAKGNLIRLPSPAFSYRNMDLRVWWTSCGKDTIRDPHASRPIFKAIAEAIETKPDDEWLIIGDKAKPNGLDVFHEVKESLPIGRTCKLHYIHWGIHAATNEYSHIRNVIVLGSHLYSNADYDALAIAAKGGDPSSVEDEERAYLKVSEAQHNLLQGIMRSNARNAVSGVCGECTVYVIASPVISAEAFRKTFPGAQITKWKERINNLSEEAKLLLEYVANHLKSASFIKKGQACRAVGINPRSLSGMLNKPSVMNAFKLRGIKWDYNNFRVNNA
ncbi:hypothetical protein [Sphingomonas sp. Leaf257]|jgi:hypothetical protein|uniref:hypothetical protein n=1 Tax=Sphingomonas sp. Leaf257 TaxID=1736309 RepID=UPI0012E30BC6|nr:hypothetical protein [Sphingomonas sp. Leaf257]